MVDWINEIKTNENHAIAELYRQFRGEILGWLSHKYQLTEREGLDIFQEAIIVLYDNVQSKKLTSLTGSIKSYLFSISRNKAMEHFRDNSKYEKIDGIADIIFSDQLELEDKKILEVYIDTMNKCLVELGDPCKSILEMYYYGMKNMTEITNEIGYNNANTTKNQKYKCVKRLQKLFKLHIEI